MTSLLHSPRVRLRRFNDSDWPAFLAYRNDEEVARFQAWTAPDEVQARAFIAEQRNAVWGAPGVGCQVAVALLENDLLIGDCYFKVDSFEPRQAEIGYTLARDFQGRGLASEALTLLLDYLFNELNLHRVVALTQCRNEKSVALLNRLGWRQEGLLRESIFSNGAWHDEFLFALLQSEWQKVAK